jgi:hypothetical protein
MPDDAARHSLPPPWPDRRSTRWRSCPPRIATTPARPVPRPTAWRGALTAAILELFSGAVEIGRHPGVVQVTFRAPVDHLRARHGGRRAVGRLSASHRRQEQYRPHHVSGGRAEGFGKAAA